MHAFSILCAPFLPLLALSWGSSRVVALPSRHLLTARGSQASDPPFDITHLLISDIVSGNSTIQFSVHDPDPLADATALCSGVWVHNSTGYPQGSYSPCGNSTFAWNMASYTSLQEFQLGIEHVFEDPAIGQYPYDYITNFARATVNTSVVACTALRGRLTCQQSINTTIRAGIYATEA